MEDFIKKFIDLWNKIVDWIKNFDLEVFVTKIEKTDWNSVFFKIREWGKKNLNNILIVAGVVVVCIFGIVWMIYEKNKKEEEARRYFAQVLNFYNHGLHSSNPEEKNNDFQKAMQILQEMQRRFPSSLKKDVIFYMGHIFYESGQYMQALEQYEEIVRLFPKSYMAPFAQECIGYCYEQSNDLDKAIEAFSKVKERWPKSPVAGRTGINLGRIYEVKGDFKSAFESYQSVQAEYPNTSWARSAYLRTLYIESRFKNTSSQ